MTANGVSSYTWDRANRLLSHDGISYGYDGLGNRVSQNNGVDITEYLLDIQPSLAVVLKSKIGSQNTHYVHGLRGIHAHDDGTDWSDYLNDGLGSVRGLLDDTQAFVSDVNYNPYGVPNASVDGFGFTGEMTDDNGLVYLRARYYDPTVGVFASLDPFEGVHNRPMSVNGYSWVEGNVANWTDASGRNPVFDFINMVNCEKLLDHLLIKSALNIPKKSQCEGNMMAYLTPGCSHSGGLSGGNSENGHTENMFLASEDSLNPYGYSFPALSFLPPWYFTVGFRLDFSGTIVAGLDINAEFHCTIKNFLPRCGWFASINAEYQPGFGGNANFGLVLSQINFPNEPGEITAVYGLGTNYDITRNIPVIRDIAEKFDINISIEADISRSLDGQTVIFLGSGISKGKSVQILGLSGYSVLGASVYLGNDFFNIPQEAIDQVLRVAGILLELTPVSILN